jgi:hypothetical protein
VEVSVRRLIQLAALVAALPAAAEPLSGAQARDLLFGLRGQTVVVDRSLSELDQTVLRMVVEMSAERMRQPLYWYAAIAYTPDFGLTTEPGPVAAANHHGVAAADRAALAACDAARPAGSRPCVVAARVLPRNYEPRVLELSFGATSAFRETYLRARGEKAMAISPGSGQFAIATGAGAADAAVARCNALSQGAEDCVVAILN